MHFLTGNSDALVLEVTSTMVCRSLGAAYRWMNMQNRQCPMVVPSLWQGTPAAGSRHSTILLQPMNNMVVPSVEWHGFDMVFSLMKFPFLPCHSGLSWIRAQSSLYPFLLSWASCNFSASSHHVMSIYPCPESTSERQEWISYSSQHILTSGLYCSTFNSNSFSWTFNIYRQLS